MKNITDLYLELEGEKNPKKLYSKIRQEAIKWIKHFKIQHDNIRENWDARCCALGAVKALQDFHSITEEELPKG